MKWINKNIKNYKEKWHYVYFNLIWWYLNPPLLEIRQMQGEIDWTRGGDLRRRCRGPAALNVTDREESPLISWVVPRSRHQLVSSHGRGLRGKSRQVVEDGDQGGEMGASRPDQVIRLVEQRSASCLHSTKFWVLYRQGHLLWL